MHKKGRESSSYDGNHPRCRRILSDMRVGDPARESLQVGYTAIRISL